MDLQMIYVCGIAMFSIQRKKNFGCTPSETKFYCCLDLRMSNGNMSCCPWEFLKVHTNVQQKYTTKVPVSCRTLTLDLISKRDHLESQTQGESFISTWCNLVKITFKFYLAVFLNQVCLDVLEVPWRVQNQGARQLTRVVGCSPGCSCSP